MTALLSFVLLVFWATAALTTSVTSGCVDDTIIFNIGNLTLTVICSNGTGGITSSTISFDSCIGNDDGQLTMGMNFSETCGNITFNGLEITADCTTLAGTIDQSSIDFNAIFEDEDGVLSCAQ
ncbi:hypothetical protein B0H16DRAFT_1879830 [Mycena metata]|uniref:Cyanovirin-N domain-containing protein n=1 Tax=Mycena metata TaxID=1033252 RepID=A0AAD7JZY3_9AGAR|nr:hypothetical protein B0H16DRAFT_1879830 [Mycena metata]